MTAPDIYEEARAVLGWNTREAADQAGLTDRNVDYLTRTGVIHPTIWPGEWGGRLGRRWAAQDIIALRCLHLLGAGHGWSPATFPAWFRSVAETIQAHTIDQLAGHYLVITHDGQVGVLTEADVAEHLGLARWVSTVIPLDQCLTVEGPKAAAT